MAKITFQDKVALNPQPSVAEINKCTDANINEIKNSVNALYDDLTPTEWVNISATGYTTVYKKVGNIVCIRCYSNENITISGWAQTVVGTIPQALRPTGNYRAPVYCKGNNNIYCQVVQDSNNVIIFNWGNAITLTDGGQMAFTLVYLI